MNGQSNGGSRLPQLRPLSEVSMNPARPNTSMGLSTSSQLKRKIPTSTSLQPDTKALKSNPVGRSIVQLSGNGNANLGMSRPASAASSRHGVNRSVDAGASKIGSGIRPPSRQQPPRTRAQTARDNAVHGRGDSGAESLAKSMVQFPSRKKFSGFDTAVGGKRKISLTSDIYNLTSAMRNLSLGSHGAVGNSDKSSTRSKKRVALKKTSYMPAKKISPPKPPRKSPKKMPTMPGGYMTRESNTPVAPAYDINVDKNISDINKFMKEMQENMGQTFTERNALLEATDLYKGRAAELETAKQRLESLNAALQRDLDEMRSSLNAAVIEADTIRRQQLNEIDDLRRKHNFESDEIKRSHRDELDNIRRENKRVHETAVASAKEGAQQLEKHHRTEMDHLRHELNSKLEDEQRARKQEVQRLQEEARAVQVDASHGQEQHRRDISDKDERIGQLAKLLDRERELNDDLRKQLNRSSEQNADLENATRNLKAQVEFLKSDSKSQSQAFADLEQQTQDALTQTEEYRSQLRKEESLRRKLLNQIQDLKGNIRVFCRVRPPLAAETSSLAQITFPDADSDCKAVDVLGQEEKSSLGKITTRNHAFNFDHSFGPSSQNAEIFAELSELVAAVCGGSFNTCIFSYGQTGSGKTFTMASPDGMIARAVDQIFDTAKDLADKGWRYTITGSFVEVYNENINDLLGRPEDFDKKKHEIRHNAQTLTTEITDVLDVELESSMHFTSVLEQALRNRSIAATKANERSSRSHSVCILKLAGENRVTGETCRSTLNLVDLAGSERLAHSQATGNRLKETQNINKSLSCLADVIAALGEAREGSHIPYRNSKLTYLLQNSLGGNSKTLMFVMISPLQEHLSETLSSLNFATKVNNTRIIRKKR